jgi:hypothetical protein
MAFSSKSYVGNGSTTDFAVTFDYLDRTHVVVRVDRVETTAVGATYTFTWLNDTTIRVETVIDGLAPSVGAEVEFIRRTPIDTPAVVFGGGAALSSENLNKNSEYLTFALQEATDTNEEFTKLYLGAFDTDPLTDGDGEALQVGAVYYNSIENALYYWTGSEWIIGESTVQSQAAAASALASADVATAQAAIATTKASEAASSAASASSDAAQTAADRVQTGLDAVATAADRVQTELDVITAAVHASTATTQATTATTQAATAVTQAGIATTQAGIATAGADTATTQAGIATTQASTATTQATTATTQAGIATTQAGVATTQAGIATDAATSADTDATTATTQAGIATTQAATATTQAGIATTQAGIAADEATTATTQAGIATTNAATATTQAGIATTQAGIATTQASTATTAASTATTQAGIATTQAGIATTQAGIATDAAAEVDLYTLDANTDIETDTSLTYAGIVVGNYVNIRDNGAVFQIVSLGSMDYDRATAGGVLLKLSSATRSITPAMFGAFGVVSVGDLDIVGTSGITDETSKLQRMFNHAIKWGCEIDVGTTNRDYGIGSTITLVPQESRNKGNITATSDGGALLALHFSNTPSFTIKNPGNARFVAVAGMNSMFKVSNPTAFVSTPPYWMEWVGVNAHGAGNALVFVETEWSYRNKYTNCKVFDFTYGWQAKWDAGSLWKDNEINCTSAAIYLDNAGDCKVSGGDIFVQAAGVLLGGGNNTRIEGVTFTGNGAAGSRYGVQLFGGSTVVTNWRSRSVHVSDCEHAGLDYLIYGVDGDADGVKEIFNVTATDNHYVRTAFQQNGKFAYLKNAVGVHFKGNSHGDLLNAAGAGPSIYIEGGEALDIDDVIQNTTGTAIHLKSCYGGSIRSRFSDCANTIAEPIILLENCNEISVVGCSVRWQAASPVVTAFVQETGTSNRNRAMDNAIDTTKLVRPYIRLGAQSILSHEYCGSTTFNPGTVAGGAGGTITNISVSGARIGDSVRVCPGQNIKGLQLFPYITASNLVNLAYKNETGGSQTLDSGWMRVIATSS